MTMGRLKKLVADIFLKNKGLGDHLHRFRSTSPAGLTTCVLKSSCPRGAKTRLLPCTNEPGKRG